MCIECKYFLAAFYKKNIISIQRDILNKNLYNNNATARRN